MILNIVLMSLSVVLITSYLLYIRRFGKLSSISAYAGPLTVHGQEFLTYVFIWLGLCFPLAWVANHWLFTIAAAFLGIIGLFNGYNPNHLMNKAQNIIHVVGVNGGILLMIIGMFFINWLLAICLIPFGIACIWLWLAKSPRHTYWIEIILIAWVIVFITLSRIILIN